MIKVIEESSLKYTEKTVPGPRFYTIALIAEHEGRTVIVFKLNPTAVKDGINILQEADILRKLKHENISELLGVIISPNQGLVFPNHNCQSLGEYLQYHPDPSSKLYERRFVTSSIVRGLVYLHSKGIANLGIHLHSIKVEVGRNGMVSSAKLKNFFYARKCLPSDDPIEEENKMLKYHIWYCSPEMQRGYFAQKSDIWQIGLVIWSVFSGQDWPPARYRRSCTFLFPYQ